MRRHLPCKSYSLLRFLIEHCSLNIAHLAYAMNITHSKKSSFSGVGLAGVCRLGRHKLPAATPALEALASKAFVHGRLNAGVG